MSSPPRRKPRPGATITAFRGILLAILLLGLVGTGAELLLLEHTEGFWLFVPLLLTIMSLVVPGSHAAARGAASLRVFQATMILLLASGVVGLLLHYRGNVEFELEMNRQPRGH